ncbi:type II toxin-antitoxin system RelE family toxin [Halanaerobium kushneri]|uniref:mRNA-degrading endonuclease RelE, toxin component of the RelBE toxin-antitoxin system n=1 Tax=Halanaerobium kushneri TaxID=56779 RepID=A0A1N7CAN5_9FIRM|nr:type II toxin-antitoxin system RelE/ParE family toxin [Halanaerobium kushneri]SIR60464.1 mRNA-degrading endonuclease RelE, toxin component of the RelBE toxin-antitoxin system [Halanaerobium kushneri]
MSDYSIEIIKSVKDDLKSLKHQKEKAIKKIITLENNPIEKSKSLSGTLKGLRSFNFSLNDGQYRAIFKILEDNKICLMIIIGSRQNIYLEAKRRVKILKKQGLL